MNYTDGMNWINAAARKLGLVCVHDMSNETIALRYANCAPYPNDWHFEPLEMAIARLLVMLAE